MAEYQTLYRAWRPMDFRNIVGQDAVVTTLRRQVETDRIGHAYLFCGTRGTGKTSAARVFTRAVNCLDRSSPEPCGVCAACKSILAETCMDVQEIDAASNNSVDEIRDLRDKIKYPPTSVKYKVYIIDEVHMLSSGAFNALLKTLEEPPAHAILILATTEPDKLLPTIRSRCQRFDFHRIRVDTIVERLRTVVAGMGRAAVDDALYDIARASEGAMRDALSLLDVCLSSTDGVLDSAIVREMLGTVGRDLLFDLTGAMLINDAAGALHLIDRACRQGLEPGSLLKEIADHLRMLLLSGIVGQGLAGIAEVSEEDAERFRAQTTLAPEEKITRALDLFLDSERMLRLAADPRTILELCVVRVCRPEEAPDASLAERLAKIERSLAQGFVPAAAPTQTGAPSAATEAAQETETGEPASSSAQKKTAPAGPEPPKEWLEALRRLGEEERSLLGLCKAMTYGGETDGVVIGLFDSRTGGIFKGIAEKKKDRIGQVLTECYGRPTGFEARLSGKNKAAAGVAGAALRETLDQTYDLFGRENVILTD